MSITDETENVPSITQDSTLAHMVSWVHDMYSRGRDPLESLITQCEATNFDLQHATFMVAVACQPGGPDPKVEASKRRYVRAYTQHKNNLMKMKGNN